MTIFRKDEGAAKVGMSGKQELGGPLGTPDSGGCSRQHSGVSQSTGQLPEWELLLMILVSAVAFVLMVSSQASWRDLILHYGDNGAYAEVTTAIRQWNFRGIDIQHFMGYPYFVAAVSFVFHIPVRAGIWLVACASSFAAVLLVGRLFGNWVAAYFALSNFAWLQLSFIGGSEPLAVALSMGALCAFRERRLFWAALMGAVAVTVRPLMVFILVGMGLVLLYRRQLRAFAAAVGISFAIAGLYVLPLALYFGDPLLTVHSYTARDYGAAKVSGPHGHLFGWPFHGIVAGTMAYPAPWTNLVLSFFWIGLVLLGIAAMFSKRFRQYVRSYPNEGIYCALYLLSIFCYDYLLWARSNFMRFSIPALPLIFYALLPWLPKNRAVLWTLALASTIAAAFSAVGIRNVRLH